MYLNRCLSIGAICLLFFTLAEIHAENFTLLDDCRSVADWKLSRGTEFPGASGKLTDTAEGIAINYDFSAGGQYISISPGQFSLPDSTAYRLVISTDQPIRFCYRLQDVKGRTFHSAFQKITPIQKKELILKQQGEWINSWGGDPKVKTFTRPVKNLELLFYGLPEQKQGQLVLHSLSVAGDAAERLKAAPPVKITAAGWTVAGQWNIFSGSAILNLQATAGQNVSPVWLEIIFPEAGRDKVRRFFLNSQETQRTIRYRVPFTGMPNSRNRYSVTVALRSESGEYVVATSYLPGKLSDKINLGKPRKSSDIATSPFGINAHFSYYRNENFAIWRQREKLMQRIADAGFKYFRNGISLEKNTAGKPERVSPYDLQTIALAKKLGIRQILEIWMDADESIPDFLQRLDIIIRDTRQFSPVYELGNEPNNFGGWRQHYQYKGKDGSWNGFEKDGSISEWVKAHLKATNTAADYIRSIAPEAKLIGLGSVPPTNFHALELGVSKNLNGITCHPYSYSLPPEILPYGHGFNGRDGIAVGDNQHTFAGLVKSYYREFEKSGCKRELWNTEYGFPVNWEKGNKSSLYGSYTEEAQAVYLIRRSLECLALEVSGIIPFMLVDNYGGDPFNPEANFGLLRADLSPRAAYFAMQRINSLFAEAVPDKEVRINITAAPLHPYWKRINNARQWDTARISFPDGVRCYGFVNPQYSAERLLAVWSMLPYSREFNNRTVTLEVTGWEKFNEPAVAINLLTGETYDVVLQSQGGKIIIDKLSLKEAPLVLKFFSRDAGLTL